MSTAPITSTDEIQKLGKTCGKGRKSRSALILHETIHSAKNLTNVIFAIKLLHGKGI